MNRLFFAICFYFTTVTLLGQNPIITDIYTADPAAMVYNDTVYLYTGHDEGVDYYSMYDWQLFTSTDMVNWESHGEVFSVDEISWSIGDAWASEVIEKDGKFYFYFCTEHESGSGKALGVGVSDSPSGPFRDAIGSALVTNDMTTQVNSSYDDIDPTVFIDDDGQAYIYWGNAACYYAKLKDNMIELDGDIQRIELPNYTEAPFIHKKDDTYYLTYAYGWWEQIAYATSPSITGPWTFRGVLNDLVNNSNTNHQSIIEYKNQWYFVYHTGDIGGSYQRSVAIDYLYYNEDGTIREIVQTKEGVQNTDQTENCLPQPIDISYKIDNNDWQPEASIHLVMNDKITIRSEVDSQNGSWEWTGPNDFISTTNEILFEEVTVEQTGTYKAVYTNLCGTKSISYFDLSVSPIISGEEYIIKPKNSEVILAMENGSGVNGVNVSASKYIDADYQRFNIISTESKYYRISPSNALTQAWDIYNVSSDDGANVLSWEYWGGLGQQFELRYAGDGTYNIVARHSGKCLEWDVSTNNIIQMSSNGGVNQKFELIKASDFNIQTIVDAIDIPDTVKSHLHLPVKSPFGDITYQWSSSDTSIINTDILPGYNEDVKTPEGVVIRQSSDTEVTLNLIATQDDVSVSKSFNVTVLAQPTPKEYAGYLYAYFSAAAGKTEVQQIHFAISKDGLYWKDLNEHQPVLTSVLGDRGVRDPYIMRTPEGDHFYLIATDLDINASKYNNNWGLMATQGSTSLMVWESDDLVNWSDQRMINVASSINAGNAWAPEGIFDKKTNEFLVYWASRTQSDNYAKHRIWVSKTRDFIHFTEPEIYVDATDGRIDASILEENEKYYMLIKDENSVSVVLKEASQLLDYGNTTGLGNSFVKIENIGIEQYTGGYEGATMFRFNNEDKWCTMIDEYTGNQRGYIPFVSSNIEQTNSFTISEDGTYLMPTGAKHGTIIPITQDEYDALINKWSVKTTFDSPQTDPIAWYTFNNMIDDSNVIDQSTKGNDATLYGNATVVQDPEKGTALYLDGTENSYMKMPNGLFDGLDDFSISMDVKPIENQPFHFVLAIGQDNNKYAFLRVRPDQVRFATTTESYTKEQEVFSNGSFLNNWMNLKIIKSGHSTKLYINNELMDENETMRTISDLGSQLKCYLGKSFYPDPYFKGYFDNIIIYNKALNIVDFPTLTKESLNQNENFKIFSTPSGSELKIQTSTKTLQRLDMAIYSIGGNLIVTKKFKQISGDLIINLHNLKTGIYIVKVNSNLGSINYKFIRKH